MEYGLSDAWGRYTVQLRLEPLRTKSISAAIITGLSDIIAQYIVHGRCRSWKRVLALFIYGGLYSGPSGHYWQRCVEHLFEGKSDDLSVLRKVLVDQTLYGPVCNVLFMSYVALVLDGLSWTQLRGKLDDDFPRVQHKAWEVWPLAAVINYRLVPLQFRVLFINCVALCWSVFLLIRWQLRNRATAVTAAAATADGAALGGGGGSGGVAAPHAAGTVTPVGGHSGSVLRPAALANGLHALMRQEANGRG